MHPAEPVPSAAWQARLHLGFQRRDAATLLVRREHLGPLRVQKALYPEGAAVCHAIVLHPPAGIVGGDELAIHIDMGSAAHALLTTPGAGKWYRSAGPLARQALHFDLAPGSLLEWLPQESIFFSGARAHSSSQIRLHGDARFIGWEVLCLGRRAAGESFDQGELRLETRIDGDAGPRWLERGRLLGNDPLLASPVGLAGKSVCATLLAAGLPIDPALLAAARAIPTSETDAQAGLTALPELLVARYLGHSAEAARLWLSRIWQLLRPLYAGRPAITPRIWNT